MNRSDRDPLSLAAARLRERGIAPGHDLWPGISAAIDRQEAIRPQVRPVRRFEGWLRLSAVAAVLALLFVVPVREWRHGESAVRTAVQGLAVVDQALAQVNQALAQDPQNQGLARLVLQLHQSRAELLRRDTEDKVRSL